MDSSTVLGDLNENSCFKNSPYCCAIPYFVMWLVAHQTIQPLSNRVQHQCPWFPRLGTIEGYMCIGVKQCTQLFLQKKSIFSGIIEQGTALGLWEPSASKVTAWIATQITCQLFFFWPIRSVTDLLKGHIEAFFPQFSSKRKLFKNSKICIF